MVLNRGPAGGHVAVTDRGPLGGLVAVLNSGLAGGHVAVLNRGPLGGHVPVLNRGPAGGTCSGTEQRRRVLLMWWSDTWVILVLGGATDFWSPLVLGQGSLIAERETEPWFSLQEDNTRPHRT